MTSIMNYILILINEIRRELEKNIQFWNPIEEDIERTGNTLTTW